MPGIRTRGATQYDDADKPITLHINYKSGRSITLLVTDWSLERNTATDELTHFRCDYHPENKLKLPYLGLTNIESITKEV